MRAVIDRIEDGKHAVLLIEDREERIVPVEQLPEGAREGDWLDVTFQGDRVVAGAIDQAQTERMQAEIRDKMEQLRKRGRRGSGG